MLFLHKWSFTWLTEESPLWCVSVSELCNLLQLRRTVQGQTGCRDNDPSLSEAPSL